MGKKLFFIFVILISTAINIFAQGIQTATLHHNGNIKIYTSAGAFSQAISDSEHGDIIALSPGIFTAQSITKAVTIRGAGLEAVDSLSSFNRPTIFSGDFTINIPDSISNHSLYVEGITHTDATIKLANLNNATFAKCKFNIISYSDYSNSKANNLSFIHCIILGKFSSPQNISLNAYNCVFNDFSTTSNVRASFSFYNCVFNQDSYSFHNSYIENCILNNTGTSKLSISSTSNNVVAYTLWVGSHSSNPFPGTNSNRNNYIAVVNESVFNNNQFYSLVNPNKYIGSDGNCVGIYGGANPFSAKSSYPRIKSLKVSPESTIDGKLNIQIEVSED